MNKKTVFVFILVLALALTMTLFACDKPETPATTQADMVSVDISFGDIYIHGTYEFTVTVTAKDNIYLGFYGESPCSATIEPKQSDLSVTATIVLGEGDIAYRQVNSGESFSAKASYTVATTSLMTVKAVVSCYREGEVSSTVTKSKDFAASTREIKSCKLVGTPYYYGDGEQDGYTAKMKYPMAGDIEVTFSDDEKVIKKSVALTMTLSEDKTTREFSYSLATQYGDDTVYTDTLPVLTQQTADKATSDRFVALGYKSADPYYNAFDLPLSVNYFMTALAKNHVFYDDINITDVVSCFSFSKGEKATLVQAGVINLATENCALSVAAFLQYTKAFSCVNHYGTLVVFANEYDVLKAYQGEELPTYMTKMNDDMEAFELLPVSLSSLVVDSEYVSRLNALSIAEAVASVSVVSDFVGYQASVFYFPTEDAAIAAFEKNIGAYKLNETCFRRGEALYFGQKAIILQLMSGPTTFDGVHYNYDGEKYIAAFLLNDQTSVTIKNTITVNGVPCAVTDLSPYFFYYYAENVEEINGLEHFSTIPNNISSTKWYTAIPDNAVRIVGTRLVATAKVMSDNYVMPDSVTEIFDNCFADYGGSTITLSSALTKIGDSVLMNAASLVGINLGDCANLTTIGKDFLVGSGLEAVDFSGASLLTDIGDGLLSRSLKLKTLVFDGALKEYDFTMLRYTPSFEKVTYKGEGITVTGLNLLYIFDCEVETPADDGYVTIGEALYKAVDGGYKLIALLNKYVSSFATEANTVSLGSYSIYAESGILNIENLVLNDTLSAVEKDAVQPGCVKGSFSGNKLTQVGSGNFNNTFPLTYPLTLVYDGTLTSFDFSKYSSPMRIVAETKLPSYPINSNFRIFVSNDEYDALMTGNLYVSYYRNYYSPMTVSFKYYESNPLIARLATAFDFALAESETSDENILAMRGSVDEIYVAEHATYGKAYLAVSKTYLTLYDELGSLSLNKGYRGGVTLPLGENRYFVLYGFSDGVDAMLRGSSELLQTGVGFIGGNTADNPCRKSDDAYVVPAEFRIVFSPGTSAYFAIMNNSYLTRTEKDGYFECSYSFELDGHTYTTAETNSSVRSYFYTDALSITVTGRKAYFEGETPALSIFANLIGGGTEQLPDPNSQSYAVGVQKYYVTEDNRTVSYALAISKKDLENYFYGTAAEEITGGTLCVLSSWSVFGVAYDSLVYYAFDGDAVTQDKLLVEITDEHIILLLQKLKFDVTVKNGYIEIQF